MRPERWDGVPIKVALADKNPLVRKGLGGLFDADPRFSLAITVKDAQSFLVAVEQNDVDVAVIGWVLPPLGGAAVLDNLRERGQGPRVVVYSGSSDLDTPRKVMACGGAGFCSKSDEPEQLIETVHAVAGGKMVFPFVDVRSLHNDPLQHLTPKERELLAALATGRTNNQLASDFGVSVNTVKFHLRNLFDKLSIHNRTQAVAAYYASLGN